MSDVVLQRGDVLLYRPKGAFGWLIRLKTWHKVAHCECYVGEGHSVASRDGKGVNVYPWRNTELTMVLRPKKFFAVNMALEWFDHDAKGKPYGWLDLGAFVGLPWETRGMFCSEFLTLFLRAGGVPVFNDEKAIDVAPFQFETSELLEKVWSEDVGNTGQVSVAGGDVVPEKS